MKKIKVLILLISVFLSLNLLAQKLTGEIKNSEQKTLVLTKYNFTEKEFVDSIYIKNNFISYNISKLTKGMYCLENKNVSIDFIYNSEDIDINYDVKSDKEVVYNKSIENKILNEFFDFYEDNNLAYNLLKQLERYYPKTDNFYKDIIDKIEFLKEKNKNYIDSINKYYQNTFASEILNLYRPHETGLLDNTTYYSTDLKNTVFLGDLLISYLNTFQKKNYTKEQQENAFKPAIDDIFNSLNKNSELSIYVSEFLIDQFRYFDFEMISEYIAIKSSEFDNSCIDDEKLKEKLNNIEALLNVKLGNQAPDFELNNGKTLYERKANYKVIIFWASWCPHCETLINQMISKQNNLSDNAVIITYSLDFENDDWENMKKDFPKEWINICMCNDKDEKIPDSYAVYSTPSIFILDDTNMIIDKPKKFQEFEGLIY